jgi:ApbE superfamily uncharacterized protein (UPF0280 family)
MNIKKSDIHLHWFNTEQNNVVKRINEYTHNNKTEIRKYIDKVPEIVLSQTSYPK